MAYIDLGDDTNINVDLSSTTPINTELPDINYIPGYKKAEEERRANEVIRQENEQDRIALYNDMEYKKETDYYRGRDGAIQYRAGTNIEITDDYVINCTGGSSETSWGDITGTLANQTDLQSALDLKANASSIPTKTSDLNNDSGFITKDVNNLTNYTKTIDMQDHLTNTSSQVDTDYKVNVLYSNNILDISKIVKGRLDSGVIGYESNTTNLTINKDSFSFTTNANYRGVTSDFIKVNGTEYLCSCTTPSTLNIIVACYDSNKNYLRDSGLTYITGHNNQAKITLQNDVAFIRIYFYLSTSGTITIEEPQLIKGFVYKDYEPFIPNTINVNNEKYTDTINVGTSINDKNRVNVLYSKNLFDKDNAVVLDLYFDDNDVLQASSYNKLIYIPCKPNTTYTLQKEASPATRQIGYTTEYPAVNVQVYGKVVIATNGTSGTITSGANAKYLVCRFYQTSQDTSLTIPQMLATIQVEYGSEATTYEPYIIPAINVDGEEIYNAGKDVISVKMSSDFTLGTTNAYVDIPFPTIIEKVGTNFEINSSNQIVCKKDGYIKIGCHFNYLTVASSGNKWCVVNVYHSSNVGVITLNPYGTQGERLDVSGASRLVKVFAGDTIRPQTYGNASDVLRADYSYITCEYV